MRLLPPPSESAARCCRGAGALSPGCRARAAAKDKAANPLLAVPATAAVDRERPASTDLILKAADDVAPWAPPKVEWRREPLKRTTLEPGTGVVAIHACGLRTDRAIELAVEAGGAIAALPCCRPHRGHPAPEGLKLALGADEAIDVHRTYALERAGHRVRWKSIVPTISPMNRVLIASARRTSGA